jgi:hypothetical protein
MSSDSKSGGSGKINVYYGTIAGVLGVGPAWSLEYIIVNGKVYPFNLARSGSDDYVDGTIGDLGSFRFYWGTETQTEDPVLAVFEPQPAYRGCVYIVLDHFCFGHNGETNPPNIEVVWRRLPNQTTITGTSAANDGAFSANPVAAAAELLTSWDWAGLPSGTINTATFQAAAEQLEELIPATGSAIAAGPLVVNQNYRITDFETGDDFTNVGAGSNATGVRFTATGTTPTDWTNGSVLTPIAERSFGAVSPLWNGRTDLKAALADLASIAGAWFRVGVDGKIEAGYWQRSGSVGVATALTINDLTEDPTIDVGEADELPNSFVVEFTDSSKLHKLNATSPFNTASVRSTGIVRDQTVKRPMLLRFDQANWHADDLLRQNSVPRVSFSGSVRRTRAVNADGSPIRPGDYFTYPIQAHPEDTADVRLFRCTRRSFEPTGPILLSGDLETNGEVSAITPNPLVTTNPDVLPPIYYRRIVALHPETVDDQPPVFLLAARPGNLVTGVNVLFDTNSGGDFPVLAGQTGFALPLSLVASFADSATTIRVKLLPDSSGLDAQRDVHLLSNWTGGTVEGADDQLLIVLLRKDGSGNIIYKGDAVTPWVEVLSVNGAPSLFAADTYDVPVLRGRRGTGATAFTAGSFPDAFSGYEAWLFRRATTPALTHGDFAALIVSQDDAFFRYSTFGPAGAYSPGDAYVEYQRRAAESIAQGEFVNQTSTAHQPTDTFVFPPTALAPISLQAQGYTILLTNEAHTVACNSAGTVNAGQLGASGTAKTDVQVFQADVALTAVTSAPTAGQFSIALGTLTDATATKEDDNTVRCDTLSADTGSIAIVVTMGAGFSVTKIFTLTKARSGTNGTNGTNGTDGNDGNDGTNGTNGTNGAAGERGSKHFYASGTSWSDATANSAVTAAGLTKVLLDQVTISGSNFAETRFWNGTSWLTITQVIDGNLLVNGTVAAAAIVAGNIAAINIAHTGRIYNPSYPSRYFQTFEMGVATATHNWGSGAGFTFTHHTGLRFDGPGASGGTPIINNHSGAATVLIFATILNYSGTMCVYYRKNGAGSYIPLAALTTDDGGNAVFRGLRRIAGVSATDYFHFFVAPCDANGDPTGAGITKTFELDVAAINW